MPPLLVRLYLSRIGDAAKPLLERVEGNIRMHLDFVEQDLNSHAFIAGREITAADIQMSFPVELIVTQKLIGERHGRVRSWITGLHDRPAYKRALEKGGPYAFGVD